MRYLVVLVIIFTLFACDENDTKEPKTSDKIKFLTYSNNPSDKGLAIIEVDNSDYSYTIKNISSTSPYYKYNYSVATNGSKYSFISTSNEIVFGDINSTYNVVPTLPIPEGYDFCSQTGNHTYPLSDGRVVFFATYGYDFGNGAFNSLYIYDPREEDYAIFGDLDDYAINHPAADPDTESGDIIDKGLAVSKDQKYIYCMLSGWGVEGNSIHQDFYEIVRYDLTNGNFDKVKLTERDVNIVGISFDNSYLICSVSGGLEIIDLTNVGSGLDCTSYIISIPKYSTYSYTDISKNSNEMIIKWRAGGLGIVNFNSGKYTELIKAQDMSDEYRGLGYGVNYSDLNSFYFNASSDFNTNGNEDFTLFKYNLSTNVYDSLLTISEDIYYSLFIKLD